jgi:hypothetical protein
MEKVFCEECQKEGLKSTVVSLGTFSTCMGWNPFYDEEGRYHAHDPNYRNERLNCSNGHVFIRPIKNTCWCGWEGK